MWFALLAVFATQTALAQSRVYGPATQYRPAMPDRALLTVTSPAATAAKKLPLTTTAAAKLRIISHQERYPHGFNPNERYPGGFAPRRYPGGFAPQRYPGGQYLGGYRYPFGYDYYNYGQRGQGRYGARQGSGYSVIELVQDEIAPMPAPSDGAVVGPPVESPNVPQSSTSIVAGGAYQGTASGGSGMGCPTGGCCGGGYVGQPAWTTGDFFDVAIPYGRIPNYGPSPSWWHLGWPAGYGPFQYGRWAWNPFSYGALYGQTAWNWSGFWGYPGGWGWGGLGGPWFGGAWTGYPYGGWGWSAWGW